MLRLAKILQAPKTLARVSQLGPNNAPGLVGSFSLTVLTTAGVLLINLGSGVAQARGLGPAGRGELAVAMLWPTLIAGLGSLGVREALTYQSAREPCGRSQGLVTAMGLAAVQMGLLALLAWILFPVLLHNKPPQVLHETTFYLWFLLLFPLVYYPQSYFQGRMAMGAYNLVSLCVSITSTVILVGLFLSHRMTVHSALVASLVAYGATAALALAFLLARNDWSWRPDLSLARPLLSFGIRQQLGSATLLASQLRLDLLVLSLLVAPGMLGTYTVATSAAAVAALLPSTAGLVLLPAFARQGAAAFPTTLAQVLFAGSLLTLVTGPILVGLLPIAVPIVFGPGFAAARPLTALLAVGFLIRGWDVMLAAILVGAGKPFTASIGQGLELALLAVLLIALAPRFEATGAALSVAVAAAVSLVCLLGFALATARLSLGDMAQVWARELSRCRRWIVAPTSGDLPGL